MLPEESQRVGDYELLEEIGQGGFSRVHRVRKGDADYAAKILSVDGGRPSPEVVARFEREIEVLASIRHPHLIALIDSGVDEAHGPYLITPLVRGMTLRDLARAPLPPPSALVLIEPVFAAVSALHAAGLVHRDLKPENVMVTPSGDVVLVDLGLALSEAHSRLTRSGTVTGSVPYMSPEQISAEPLGPPSDVWSLAVTLYELVAGRRPFARERPSEELAAILAGGFDGLADVDRRVAPALEALVARSLEADPARRYPDAAAAHAALLTCIDWCDHGALRSERVAAITDPAAYVDSMADGQVARLRGAARDLIETGDSFAALRVLDRALAYRPEDEAILELVVEASERAPAPERASVESAARRLFGEHGPPASVDGFVDWVEKRISDGLSGRPPGAAGAEDGPSVQGSGEPPRAPSGAPASGTRRRSPDDEDDGSSAFLWIVVGGLGVAFLGLVFLVAIVAVLR